MRVNRSYLSHQLEHTLDIKRYQTDPSIDRFERIARQNPSLPSYVEYMDSEEREKN